MSNLEKRIANLEAQMASLIKTVSRNDEYTGYDIDANRINTSKVSSDLSDTNTEVELQSDAILELYEMLEEGK